MHVPVQGQNHEFKIIAKYIHYETEKPIKYNIFNIFLKV